MSSGPRNRETPPAVTQDKLNELEMQRHVHGKGASRTQTDWLLRTCNELIAERDQAVAALQEQAERFDREFAEERKRAIHAEERIIRARRAGLDV